MLRPRALLLCLLTAVAAVLPAPALADDPSVIDHADPVQVTSDARLRAFAERARDAGLAQTEVTDGGWCGTPRATDHTAAAAHIGPRVKAIYAYPSGSPNRFGTLDDLIQADVRVMTDVVAGAADGLRTLRFDLGNDCGAGVVDVLTYALPRTKAEYLAIGNVVDRTLQLIADLGPVEALMERNGPFNYTVYADHLYGGDGVAGIAETPIDDRKLGNSANSGGRWAFAFGHSDHAAFAGDRVTTVLHETAHNLGAVQESSPHGTPYGHCTDERDVMCYADGPGVTTSLVCVAQAFDCNRDDYFSPAPPAGSYLATKWNLFDAAFMCPIADCTAQVPPPPPVQDATAPPATPPVGGGDAVRQPQQPAPGAGAVGPPPQSDTRTAPGTTTPVATPRAVGPAPLADVLDDALAAAVRPIGRRAPRRISVRLTTATAGRLAVEVRAGTRVLGRLSRTVVPGRAARVVVPLTNQGRRLAARRRRLTVKLVFRPAAGGATRTSAATVRLSAR